MSANHTKMSSDTFKALMEELKQLKQGNGQAIRAAEERIQKMLKDMKEQGERTGQQFDEKRRCVITQLQQQQQAVRQAALYASDNLQQLQQQQQQLSTAIKQASAQVSSLVEEDQRHAQSAQQLHAQVQSQYTASITEPYYQKFASGDLAAIGKQLQMISQKQANAAAMQQLAVSAMNDIYQMDLRVTTLTSLFEASYLRAQQLAGEVLAHSQNARSGNRADLKDPHSELLDINYWTDGRFDLMESEVKDIQQRLDYGQFDANYDQYKVDADLCRLQELDQIEQQLVAEAREAYNHSLNREAQALTCQDILTEDFGFAVVGSGYDMNDRREAYVLRLRRHDGAEVEVIVNQGKGEGNYEVYFRVDSMTYMDQDVMKVLTDSIAKEFGEAGVNMRMYRHCSAEPLEPFNPSHIQISPATRTRHGIQRQQRKSSI